MPVQCDELSVTRPHTNFTNAAQGSALPGTVSAERVRLPVCAALVRALGGCSQRGRSNNLKNARALARSP
jgi:hypothetical protein